MDVRKNLSQEKLNSFLEANKKCSFSERFFALVKEKKYKINEIYKNSNVDRRIIHKMKKPNYHPSKNIAIALCFGLRLTLLETIDLLSYAGYSLSYSIDEDLIVIHALMNKIYDITELNIILYDYKCKILGSIPRD